MDGYCYDCALNRCDCYPNECPVALAAAFKSDPPPTLGEVRPEAVLAWNCVRAVLPPSDPSDPEDPSVNLDRLMAMLHAALTMDKWVEKHVG